ncbi:O-antigen ligase family protein [Desulfogranum japonicum]|uniref:O-antigen ligase family protein n=1 Tax=Desulfogranum japonicum TaxID=231447 RepID=UPI0004120E78|nr:O-antigen ligase family protein [Desulfogranum japonicum]
MSNFRKRVKKINFWCTVGLVFSLPLSTSAISIFACLIFLLWLMEGEYRAKFQEMMDNPVCLAVFFFIFCIILGLLWSADTLAGLAFIEKMWKVMLMPVFLTVVCTQRRHVHIWAFIIGIIVAMSLTYLAWFGLIQYADVTPQHLTKKTFHVVYNPMLAFAIYCLAYELYFRVRPLWARLSGTVLLAVMIFNMFITEGRAGQLVFLVLVGVFFLQLFRRHIGLAFAGAMLSMCLLFGAAYTTSPVFRQRVDTAHSEIAQFKDNANTSIGLRLLFWENSWDIIKNYPLLGVGTGDFESEYRKVNERRSPHIRPTDNPHNQYVLMATRLGLLGIVALFWLLYVQFRAALQTAYPLRHVLIAFPVFYMVIMLTESYLVVYETGFLFSLFSAVLYKKDQVEQTTCTIERAA